MGFTWDLAGAQASTGGPTTVRCARGPAGGGPVTGVHNSIFFVRAVPLVDVQMFGVVPGVMAEHELCQCAPGLEGRMVVVAVDKAGARWR